MSVAAVVLGPGRGRGRARSGARALPSLASVAGAAAGAGFDELIVVVEDEAEAAGLPDSATVLVDHARAGAAGALRVAIDWSQREGHDALVVALPPPASTAAQAETDAIAWKLLLAAGRSPIVVATTPAGRASLVRLAAEIWALAPLEGDPGHLLSAHSELVSEIALSDAKGDPLPKGEVAEPPDDGGFIAEPDDREAVRELLGREPQGPFRVVVRDRDHSPVVIENAPFLADGTPMPTRYWLVGRRECEAVGRLEAAGGVRRANEEIPPALVEASHARYAAARDAAVAADHRGPRPTGGVGGTRVGVKCLHAHLAFYLAGGGDPVGRWVAEQLGGEVSGAVAGIDCGTNSTRLLIASPEGATLERKMTITRLGEGVDQSGRLSEEAMARTAAALERYRQLMDAYGVVRQRAIATSAARDASNAEEFFAKAATVLGAPPELLSGEEEGALSYAGATAGLDPADGPYLVVDLGGGSTELVAGGPDGQPAAAISLDFGCVRVTERFLASDPPTKEELLAARRFVAQAIEEATRLLPALLVPRRLVGVAGTVSTLVQLAIGLDHYDAEVLHHQLITRPTVEEIAEMLLAEPVAAHRARPGIEEGRADVIGAGALIFAEVMGHLGHDQARYSESDILDGLVAELLAPSS